MLKFHLRISKEEQRKRFLARLNEPVKRWKFSMADVTERQRWDDYMAAYEDMIRDRPSVARKIQLLARQTARKGAGAQGVANGWRNVCLGIRNAKAPLKTTATSRLMRAN